MSEFNSAGAIKIYPPDSLKKQLKELAKKKGTSMNAIACSLIAQGLANEENNSELVGFNEFLISQYAGSACASSQELLVVTDCLIHLLKEYINYAKS